MTRGRDLRAILAGTAVAILLAIAVAVPCVSAAAVIAFVLGYLLGIGHFAIAALGWILALAGLALALRWVARTAMDMAAG